MHDLHVITRELINEMLTPEEEREWMTYTANLPKKELEEAREHLVSASVITQALVRLMIEGATPESDGVQKLLVQNNQLMLRYRLRERLVTRGDWNANVAKKVHALGMRLVMRIAAPADGSVSESEVLDFCSRAKHASKWGRALEQIAAEAAVLAEREAGPHSHAAQALAERYIDLCEDHALGDPVLYGRWFLEFGKTRVNDAWTPVDERTRQAWGLLVEAVDAFRRPAGIRAAAAW